MKHKTVSCEKHFSWTMNNFTNALRKASSSANHFKERATKLMIAVSSSEYSAAQTDINNYLTCKPKKKFLTGFIEFWHPRHHHFSRGFKSSGAPKSNLSEFYHSLYVKGQTTNLTLLEDLYRDVAASIKIQQLLKMFGESFKCQGARPTTRGQNERSYQQQKSKVKLSQLF